MPKFAQKLSFLSDTELERETLEWLGNLEAKHRPVNLARDFPRVANRIAFLWAEPTLMHRYFEELILPDENDRKGFSPDAALELGTLRHLYGRLHPLPTDPWRKVVDLPGTAK